MQRPTPTSSSASSSSSSSVKRVGVRPPSAADPTKPAKATASSTTASVTRSTVATSTSTRTPIARAASATSSTNHSGAQTSASATAARSTKTTAPSASPASIPKRTNASSSSSTLSSTRSSVRRPASSSASSSSSSSSFNVPSPHVAAYPTDPLSMTITPIQYMICNHLTVSEICSLSRVNRLFFNLTCGPNHPVIWRKRFLKLVDASASPPPTKPITRVAPSASVQAPPAKQPIHKDFINERGLSVVGLAHFQRLADRVHRLPPSLPSSSPYRYAILSILRERRTFKFDRFACNRAKDVRNAGVTKPLVEELDMKMQLNLSVGVSGSASASSKVQMWKRCVKTHMHDNVIVCTWSGEAGVTIRQIKSIQLIGYSGAILDAIQMSDPESSSTRDWLVRRSGSSEHELSLVEWSYRGERAFSRQRVGAPLFNEDEYDANSPFAPNQLAQARRMQAASASAASASSAAQRAHPDSLPIPGLHLRIFAGVWGPCNTQSGPSSHEVTFLWLAISHPLVLSRLPAALSSIQSTRWKIVRDDLDSRHGLHGYQVNFALRSMTRTVCTWFYKDVDAELVRNMNDPKSSRVRLLLPSISSVLPSFAKLPGLPWQSGGWHGRFDQTCVLDVVVRSEDGQVLWIVSECVGLKDVSDTAASQQANLAMDLLHESAKRYGTDHIEPGVGMMHVELLHSASEVVSNDGRRRGQLTTGEGRTTLASFEVSLELSFVDQHFGTLYGESGSATVAHALQTHHRAGMTDQQRSEYELQQLGLRQRANEDRPLGVRGGAAAAAPFVPNFQMAQRQHHQPAAASASASSSSSSSTRRRSTAPAPRPEWNDVIERKDDDEEPGFKF